MKKDILNKLSDWQERNDKLFGEKAELQRKILAIDLEIWNLSSEYDKLCRQLLK